MWWTDGKLSPKIWAKPAAKFGFQLDDLKSEEILLVSTFGFQLEDLKSEDILIRL
jgi:hypothetical protein